MKRIETEFDEVVVSVNLNLRQQYELEANMNYGGLISTNDQYRRLSASTPWSLYPWYMFGFFAVDVVMIGAVLAAFANSELNKGHGLSHVVAIGIFLLTLAVAIMLLFYQAIDSKRRGEMTEHYQVLKRFADAVGFDPTALNSSSQYWRSISDIKPAIVQTAQKIIWAERQFDGLCHIGRPRLDDIIGTGTQLQSLERVIVQELRRAKLFAVTLERAEIFREANKIIGCVK